LRRVPRRLRWPLAAAALCVLAPVAIASPQFSATFALTYSSQPPNSPSGLDVSASWSDPGAPNGVPKGVTKIKFAGHPGLRFDTGALPQCKASDEDIANLALRACPRSTKLGTVKGEGLIVTGSRFDTVATLFNGRREIIVVVMLATENRLITYFRDDVRRSSVTVNFKIPGGVALTKFEAHLPRHYRKRGGKRRAYVRTPPTCPPSGMWTTTATFTYRDGSSQQLASNTPCRLG
jgi:hypothetical protein